THEIEHDRIVRFQAKSVRIPRYPQPQSAKKDGRSSITKTRNEDSSGANRAERDSREARRAGAEAPGKGPRRRRGLRVFGGRARKAPASPREDGGASGGEQQLIPRTKNT